MAISEKYRNLCSTAIQNYRSPLVKSLGLADHILATGATKPQPRSHTVTNASLLSGNLALGEAQESLRKSSCLCSIRAKPECTANLLKNQNEQVEHFYWLRSGLDDSLFRDRQTELGRPGIDCQEAGDNGNARGGVLWFDG